MFYFDDVNIKELEKLLINYDKCFKKENKDCLRDFYKIKKLLKKVKNTLKYYTLSMYSDILTNLLNQKFYNTFLNDNLKIKRKEEKETLNNLIKYIKEHNINSLMFIDFSNFKYINDNYGYDKGDKILEIFGDFLNSYPIIGVRRGGDEFIILGNKNVINNISSIIHSNAFLKTLNNVIDHNNDTIITFPIYGIAIFDNKKITASNFKEKISKTVKIAEENYKINKERKKRSLIYKYIKDDSLRKKIYSYRTNLNISY
ncbi:diguanylate cyclase domain-containing protein [Caminibacter mediatlanticus]|uniref:GGDEF domain-containing protein n=1 Tax=Caminibacter mediatlanticus TB-2 TaxID=391592 RepID=A0AAI9AG83_9BACT|nr:diguanylate cyclase [Caminibacter mediatlanticus]EDM22935.1 hypothetical protein CMTB2_05502 [Caminibacter mediatlanticus TB-2]